MQELLIRIDEGDPTPLYHQLYEQIRRDILSGRLAAGTRLPGKRTLSGQLGISVNTVDTAYQMLTAEGYIRSVPRSGFFAEAVPQVFSAPASNATPRTEPRASAWRYDCSTGNVDTALFPVHTWGRIQRSLLYDHPELLLHGDRQGDLTLREAIRDYLMTYRGVQCRPEQIVIGAGMEYLLGLAAKLLPAGTAAVEEPGYSRSRQILTNNGVPCVSVGLDDSGLRTDELMRSGASICYVTPSHHFPTGVTMPAGRRANLLRWASLGDNWIIEDDYDAEFRFTTRPLPSLQGMAGPEGHVIYLCTFSKSLAPGIRIACMVLPESLLPRYREAFGGYANTVSRVEQQTLCRFLTEGHFTRHINRMRQVYRRRMEALSGALENAFGREGIILSGRHNGLHLMMTLPGGPGEAVMTDRARRAGIRLSGLSEYYREPGAPIPQNTVIIGYAALREEQAAQLAAELAACWR